MLSVIHEVVGWAATVGGGVDAAAIVGVVTSAAETESAIRLLRMEVITPLLRPHTYSVMD
jgi:hypothetical protein